MGTNAELIQIMKDRKNEIVGISADYKDAISDLRQVESNFQINRWRLFLGQLPTIAQIFTVISIVAFLLYFSTRVECGVTIKALGIEISRICK